MLRYSLALVAVVAAGLTLGTLLWGTEETRPDAEAAAQSATEDSAAQSCSSCTLRHQRLSREPEPSQTPTD